SPSVKTTFDGLGRAKTVYMTDRQYDAAPGASGNYANAASVSDDVVFEQTTYTYNSDGLNELTTHRMRAHNAGDSRVGDLAALTGGDAAYVITTFTGTYFDGADRVIRTVNC